MARRPSRIGGCTGFDAIRLRDADARGLLGR